MTNLRSKAWTTLILLSFFAPALTAAVQAGSVTKINRVVTATDPNGSVRKLGEGDKVFKGERIDTLRRSAITMKFTDGTLFTLGSKSSMSIDEFAFGKLPENDRFSAKILKGAFRFVTGLLSKRKAKSMSVQLGATATIGIRGTSVAGEFDGEAATVILLEPEQKNQSTAIVVSNKHGEVTINKPGYGTEVPDANTAPSPARRMKLRTINNVMRSMSSVSGGFSRPNVGPH